MNVPPGGQGGYPGGGWQPPPWRPVPSTSTRPGTGFNKKKGGAGCAVIAIGLFMLVCVAAGAIALVFFLKGRRTATSDDRPAATAPGGSARRPLRPPAKKD